MILVDTSVWVDHLRVRDDRLSGLLEEGGVVTHPFVIGELAMGNLGQRAAVLGALADLPMATAASDAEVRLFVERNALYGRGLGYIDAHLLAAVHLTPDSRLWTRDKALNAAAERLSVAAALE